MPFLLLILQLMVTVKSFSISSPAFQQEAAIPAKYTCEGEDINPAIYLHNVPPPTKSFVLIMDDPDAPKGIFDHWLVWNIPAHTRSILENSIPGTIGKNTAGNTKYHGPCPPSGTHRYFFRVYALDTPLELPGGADRQSLEKAMEGHVLATAELMGLYKKEKTRANPVGK